MSIPTTTTGDDATNNNIHAITPSMGLLGVFDGHGAEDITYHQPLVEIAISASAGVGRSLSYVWCQLQTIDIGVLSGLEEGGVTKPRR